MPSQSVSTTSTGTIGLGESQTVQTASVGTVTLAVAQNFQTVQTNCIGSDDFAGNSGDLGSKRYRR